MRHHRDAGGLLDDLVEGGEPDDHRRHHHRRDALVADDPQFAPQLVEVAGEVRRIDGVVAAGGVGGGDRLGARLHPVGERRIGLVGEAVVVLDDVDAAGGQAAGDDAECRRRKALRLQRRGGEGAAVRLGECPEAVDADARAAERRRVVGRQLDVLQRHVGLDRRIAEQHVEELAGIGDPATTGAVAVARPILTS